MSTIDFRGETHIREGLGVTPVLGKRVMIDPSAVVMGDVALVMTSAFGHMSRCAAMYK